jgi:tRNA threonylcarbamoyladenosine dehydratase
MERFQRNISLLGIENFNKIKELNVIILGLGGVGSFALEALVRSGIENFILIDKDIYEASNINRQWPCNDLFLGRNKVDVLSEEIKKISPLVSVLTKKTKLTKDNCEETIANHIDNNTVVIDAIDDIYSKISILHFFKKNNVKFISSMGAGNVTDIDSIKYCELDKTTYCPIARVIRKELGLLGYKKDIPVVYSNQNRHHNKNNKGTLMSITASFGLRLAHWVIENSIKNQ